MSCNVVAIRASTITIQDMSKRYLQPALMRAARRKVYLTQENLAARVGCARNTISRAELGECSEKLILKIAKALEVDPESFYHVPNVADELSDDERDILQLLRGVDADGFKVVRAFILGLRANPEGPYRRPRGSA